MNYLVRNSIKIGLIASALLVVSACGGESTSGPGKTQASAPLFDQQPIEAGDICEFGGTMVRGGLDKDGDGELSESEVTSETPVCNTENGGNGDGGNGDGGNGDGGNGDGGNGDGGNGDAPDLLVKTETLEVGDESCPDGGKRVHVGYDLDGDGELSAEEIADEATKTTDLCNSGPVDACVGADQLEIVSIELEEDAFDHYEIDRPYEVRIKFNKEIDTEVFELKDILKTLGDDALNYSVDPDDGTVAILVFEAEDSYQTYAMAIAANDGCTTGTAGLLTPEIQNPQPVLNVTYDANGFSAEGDVIEVCYESRGADACTTRVRGDVDAGAPLSGCIEITATEADFTADGVPVGISCEDSVNTHLQPAAKNKTLVTAPTILSFDTAEFPGLLNAEEVDLHWETFQMESCTLSDGTDTNDVPVNQAKHSVEVEETTEFTLSCTDDDGETHHKTRRVVIGTGILGLEVFVSQRAPGFPLSYSISWESASLFGTCDLNLKYGASVVDMNNLTQQQDYNAHVRLRTGYTTTSDNSSGQELDSEIEGTATIKCKSTFAGQPDGEHTVSIVQP